jgi:hypothetical protein
MNVDIRRADPFWLAPNDARGPGLPCTDHRVVVQTTCSIGRASPAWVVWRGGERVWLA